MRYALSLGILLSLAFAPAPAPRPVKPQDAGTTRKHLEGTWTVESYTVGGVVQGGPGQTWQTVRIEKGTWSQSCRPTQTGQPIWTTPYLMTIHTKDPSRVDLAYKAGDSPLLYGVLRLDGDRLVVTHATSGPIPTSHEAPLCNGQVRWVLRRARP